VNTALDCGHKLANTYVCTSEIREHIGFSTALVRLVRSKSMTVNYVDQTIELWQFKSNRQYTAESRAISAEIRLWIRRQRLRSLPIEFSLDELDNDLAEVNLIQFGSGTLEGEADIPIDFEENEDDMSLIYSIIR
jgi:hypothetical protein